MSALKIHCLLALGAALPLAFANSQASQVQIDDAPSNSAQNFNPIDELTHSHWIDLEVPSWDLLLYCTDITPPLPDRHEQKTKTWDTETRATTKTLLSKATQAVPTDFTMNCLVMAGDMDAPRTPSTEAAKACILTNSNFLNVEYKDEPRPIQIKLSEVRRPLNYCGGSSPNDKPVAVDVTDLTELEVC